GQQSPQNSPIQSPRKSEIPQKSNANTVDINQHLQNSSTQDMENPSPRKHNILDDIPTAEPDTLKKSMNIQLASNSSSSNSDELSGSEADNDPEKENSQKIDKVVLHDLKNFNSKPNSNPNSPKMENTENQTPIKSFLPSKDLQVRKTQPDNTKEIIQCRAIYLDNDNNQIKIVWTDKLGITHWQLAFTTTQYNQLINKMQSNDSRLYISGDSEGTYFVAGKNEISQLSTPIKTQQTPPYGMSFLTKGAILTGIAAIMVMLLYKTDILADFNQFFSNLLAKKSQ
ncbi:MAG TPA: hypothetical protein VK431_03345, partial [Nitrosopumilaceae archaeon]|nr:hypothetical protein [Nitrosopumilaceae archaeon]